MKLRICAYLTQSDPSYLGWQVAESLAAKAAPISSKGLYSFKCGHGAPPRPCGNLSICLCRTIRLIQRPPSIVTREILEIDEFFSKNVKKKIVETIKIKYKSEKLCKK